MKKIVLIFTLFTTLFSCDKDDVETPPDNDSYYLAKTTPQFNAVLDDVALTWEFGLNTYQMGTAFYFPYGDSNAHLEFRLMQEGDGDNYFMLRTPLYDTSSDIEFNRVFGLG